MVWTSTGAGRNCLAHGQAAMAPIVLLAGIRAVFITVATLTFAARNYSSECEALAAGGGSHYYAR